jgi:hypothetical protein
MGKILIEIENAIKEPSHLVTFTCTFCGGTFQETLPLRTQGWSVDGCKRCSVHAPLKRGTKIRYSAYEARPNGHQYADTYLQRDAVYTVLRTKQWQHGAWVWLQETGVHVSFNIRLFTPEKFRKETR